MLTKSEFVLVALALSILFVGMPLAFVYGVAAIRGRNLSTCPSCGEHKLRRSGLISPLDDLLTIFGVFPFRCNGCRFRFRALVSKQPSQRQIAQRKAS